MSSFPRKTLHTPNISRPDVNSNTSNLHADILSTTNNSHSNLVPQLKLFANLNPNPFPSKHHKKPLKVGSKKIYIHKHFPSGVNSNISNSHLNSTLNQNDSRSNISHWNLSHSNISHSNISHWNISHWIPYPKVFFLSYNRKDNNKNISGNDTDLHSKASNYHSGVFLQMLANLNPNPNPNKHIKRNHSKKGYVYTQ